MIRFRALKARLDRALTRKHMRLRTCRLNSRWFPELGRHYVVHMNYGVVAKHVDVVEWARDEAIISPDEIIEAAHS